MVKEDSIMVHTMFISAPLSLAPMTCTVDSFKCIRADQTILAPLTDFKDNKVIPFDFFRFGWSRFRASRKLQCRVGVEFAIRWRGKKRRSPSAVTTTVRMSVKEDGKEATREPGKNPFPVSRVQKILKADTVKHLATEDRRR